MKITDAYPELEYNIIQVKKHFRFHVFPHLYSSSAWECYFRAFLALECFTFTQLHTWVCPAATLQQLEMEYLAQGYLMGVLKGRGEKGTYSLSTLDFQTEPAHMCLQIHISHPQEILFLVYHCYQS